MFCLQFEGVESNEKIRGLHHIKRWAENTLLVGGGMLYAKIIHFLVHLVLFWGQIFFDFI
jgi:hypothetical protein